MHRNEQDSRRRSPATHSQRVNQPPFGYAGSHWGAPLAGQVWNYAGWYRDEASPRSQTSNVTNAPIVNWKP